MFVEIILVYSSVEPQTDGTLHWFADKSKKKSQEMSCQNAAMSGFCLFVTFVTSCPSFISLVVVRIGLSESTRENILYHQYNQQFIPIFPFRNFPQVDARVLLLNRISGNNFEKRASKERNRRSSGSGALRRPRVGNPTVSRISVYRQRTFIKLIMVDLNLF